MNYTLTQKEYSNLKRRLTTVKNKAAKATSVEGKAAALRKLVAACKHAEDVFYEKGSPDSWGDWHRAKLDAEYELLRIGG